VAARVKLPSPLGTSVPVPSQVPVTGSEPPGTDPILRILSQSDPQALTGPLPRYWPRISARRSQITTEWFNAGRDVLAVMNAMRKKVRTPETIAERVEDMLLFGDDVPWAT